MNCIDADVEDATDEKDSCHSNVLWAMQTGITTDPDLYTNYTRLNTDSPYKDFQCAFWDKGVWNCPRPCSSTLIPACNQSAVQSTTTVAITTTTGVSGNSFPWWAWALIVSPCTILCCAAYYYWVCKSSRSKGSKGSKDSKEGRSKVKRSSYTLKSLAKTAPEPAPAPAPAPAPEPAPVVSLPLYVTPAVVTMPATYQTAWPPTPTYVAAAPATYVQAPRADAPFIFVPQPFVAVPPYPSSI